jgi:hypothetical protein
LALMSPTDPFEVKAATSHRLAIDLGSQNAILSVVAPGQSEHPHHRHFDDGIASLQQVETQGAMNRRPSQKAEVEVRDTELRLVLEPGGSVRSAPMRQAVETASAASVTRTVGRVPTVETTTP